MAPLVGRVMDHVDPWVLHEETLLDAFHQTHAALRNLAVLVDLKIDVEVHMEDHLAPDLGPYDHRGPSDLQAPSCQEEDH